MANFPTITYKNLKHKVSDGISNGAIQTKDEAITVVFNNGIGIASTYKVSFNSPHNQITGTLNSNKELTKWEARVTPAEVDDYGPTVGICAKIITGVSANTDTDFTIPITQDVFTGSPSNTYRICLMGQSSLDYSWDCTQFFMTIDANDSFIFNNAYTEVEYIESTGTQYIDTNFVASINTRLQLQTLFNTTSNLGLYGGQVQDADTGLRVFTSGNTLYVAHGGNRYQQTHSFSSNTIYTIDHTHTKFLINGASTYQTSSGTDYRNTTLTICRCNGFGGTIYTLNGRIYYCKIWDNDVLKRYFIPCIRNSDNKPGLYDKVNKVFYVNKGSGEFNYGPLKSVPQIYQQVDCIQNTDQQHIDTLVNGNNVNLKICAEYEPTSSGQMAIFSARTSSSNGISFWTDGYCHFGNSSVQVPGVSSTGKHRVELSKNGLYLDDTKLNFTAGTSMANANLILFRVLNDNRVFLGKIYSAKVYDDNILIRDLVPCYRKFDNVIGMLDLVNNVFYTNADSGKFLKGNNVNNYDYIKYKPTDADGYEVHFVN